MSINAFTQFMALHGNELLLKTEEQLLLVGVSVVAAILIGIPLGIFINRYRRFKTPVLTTVALLWTVPSLALLAMLIPFLGIGIKPALVVLTLYALLPVIRNTSVGLSEVPEASLEAACGLGFTPWQSMLIVKIPLALPMIIAGVRTATAICVGIATLAAFIGAGGLGDFINRGLATNNMQLIMLGAIPSAIMALILDSLIGWLGLHLNKRKRQSKKSYAIATVAVSFVIAITFVPIYHSIQHYFFRDTNYSGEIRIATKNFTEQYILGEIMAQLIEENTSLHVIRQFNLGTTSIVHQALMNNEIDLYPEYTGTAFLLVLKKKSSGLTAQEFYRQVKQDYKQKYNLQWLAPFGFNNSNTLVIKQSFADAHQIRTISDLSRIDKQITVGAPAEFITRPDAMPGLIKTYHMAFAAIKSLDLGLLYQAIQHNSVDVIMANSTDGRIPALHLYSLIDDKHFFPAYYAAPVIRIALLQKHPELANLLEKLKDTISEKTMQQLNYAVDVKKQTPRQVARQFLLARKLI